MIYLGIKMKSVVPYILVCLFMLVGCAPRSIRYQNDSQDFFFRPLSIRAHADSVRRSERLASVQEVQAVSSQQKAWQDSMSVLTQSTKDLLQRIEKLEEIYIQSRTRELAMEKQLSYVQNENRMLAQKMSDFEHAQYAAVPNAVSPNPDIPKIMKPAMQPQSSVSEYEGALSLFWNRHYGEAIDSFTRLLNGGVDENLSDHCVYWIGESQYAKREFTDAVKSFEKVVMLASSNKKADAYVMLGQSYEKLHQTAKARWAYEELLKKYPDNTHAALVKSRLRSFQPVKIEKRNEKRSTT
jgi:TolA-binding protein